MSDVADKGNDAAEFFQDIALRRRFQDGPAATGCCLNCGEKLTEPGARWCDVDCRDDWQRSQRDPLDGPIED